MSTVTSGTRIKIRHKKLSDAIEDYAWQTDAELARLDAAVPLQMTYQRYVSEYNFELSYPNTKRCEFAVDTLDGKHIGNCVYYNISPSESQAEMGIMVGNRDYWNQGYGSEIINAFLEYIFKYVKLDRIYLTTLTWNTHAQKCFKKCGFKEAGFVERDHHTFLLMSVYREDWEKVHSQTAEGEPSENSVEPNIPHCD